MSNDAKKTISLDLEKLATVLGVEVEELENADPESVIDMIVEHSPAADHSACQEEIDRLRKQYDDLKREYSSLERRMKFQAIAAQLDAIKTRINSLAEKGAKTEEVEKLLSEVAVSPEDVAKSKGDATFSDSDLDDAISKSAATLDKVAFALDLIEKALPERPEPETGRTTKPPIKMSDPSGSEGVDLAKLRDMVAQRLNSPTK